MKASTSPWNYVFSVILLFMLIVLVLDGLWQHFTHNERKSLERTLLELSLNSPIHASTNADLAVLNENLGKHFPNVTIQTITHQDIHQLQENATPRKLELIQLENREYWLLASATAALLIGPLPSNNTLQQSLPALTFYILLGVVLSLWLRPIIKGLNTLNTAATSFADNPKQPYNTLEAAYPVKTLADSFNTMANKISDLFTLQKDLTHGLSHELRTPLARSKFALAGLEQNAKQQPLLASLAQDINEMETIVDDLLRYAQLDNLQQVYNPVAFDTNEYIKACIAQCLNPKQHAIHIDANHKNGLTGDPQLLQLALSNIINNACHYATSQVRIQTVFTNQGHVINVEDDGCGMTDEQKQTATKPFSKGQHSNGHGFGLAFVSRIMELHDGSMSISDSPLGGCCISIAWPRKQL